jgi:RecA-family ATPase
MKKTVYSFHDIMNMKEDDDDFLLEEILPKGVIATIIGQGDTGKSYLCLDLARAVCNKDGHFIGKKLNIKHASAIYVSTEDGPKDHKRRFSFVFQELIKNMEGFRAIYDAENLDQKLKEELIKNPADLIIIDPLGDVFKDDINNGIQVRKFLDKYKKIASEFNCSIVFLHHISKSKVKDNPGKYDAVGSEAITSASRVIMNYSKKENGIRILTITKSNHLGDKNKDKGIELLFDTCNLHKATGVEVQATRSENSIPIKNNLEVKQQILELFKQNKSIRDIVETLNSKGVKIGKTTVSEIIKDLNLEKSDDNEHLSAAA